MAGADTRAEAVKKTTCPICCPVRDSVLQVFRYRLAPKKTRSAKKSRAKDHR
jgi:hypothetical protein